MFRNRKNGSVDMFTGLVETTGVILGRKMTGDAGKLIVDVKKKLENLKKGESIAVNGACLTLEQGMDGGPLTFHVMRETFSRTNLGSEPNGALVNLERALAANGRLGGHIVSGHVDATARILSFERRASDTELEIELPRELEEFFVEKGSITVDGISLTIEQVRGDRFKVGIIPTTWEETSLRTRKKGDSVNLETDVIGKYVVSYLNRLNRKGSNVTMETLAGAGFL